MTPHPTSMSPGNRRVSLPQVPEPDPQPPLDAGPNAGATRGARVFGVLRTLAGVALVAGTSVGVAWVARRHVMTSPRFALTSIEVTGNDQRSTDALVAESGLRVGDNVFAADSSTARRRGSSPTRGSPRRRSRGSSPARSSSA